MLKGSVLFRKLNNLRPKNYSIVGYEDLKNLSDASSGHLTLVEFLFSFLPSQMRRKVLAEVRLLKYSLDQNMYCKMMAFDDTKSTVSLSRTSAAPNPLVLNCKSYINSKFSRKLIYIVIRRDYINAVSKERVRKPAQSFALIQEEAGDKY